MFQTTERTTVQVSGGRHALMPMLIIATLIFSGLGFVHVEPSHAVTGISSGGSIVYVKDYDIWFTSPDGAMNTRFTSNGATASPDGTGGVGYRTPSHSDDGSVVVAEREQVVGDEVQGWIWVMDRRGGVIRKFKPPQNPRVDIFCSGGELPQGIQTVRVSPDGTKIAYSAISKIWYADSWGNCLWRWKNTVWVVNIDGANPVKMGTNQPILAGPSWASNTRLLMHNTNVKGEVWYADYPNAQATLWTTSATSEDRAYAFPGLAAGKLVTRGPVYNSSTLRDVQTLRVWSATGPPAAPTRRCDLTAKVGGPDSRFGNHSFARDGKALVWYEGDGTNDEPGEGLQIMAVGDPATTACPAGYVRQQLVAGGYDVYWGPAPMPGTFFAINDISITEGNSGTKVATLTITRSGDTTVASSVQWATANATATAPSDYVAGSGEVTFAANDPTNTTSVSVTINGDTAVEPNETFKVILSNARGGTISRGAGVATMTNDDTCYVVNDVSVAEGNLGTRTVTFTVSRRGVTTGSGSVTAATQNGTAVASGDFVAAGPMALSFAAGQIDKQVSVTINGDAAVEPNETFSLRLTSPVGGTICDDTGIGTIVNDDTALAINDLSIAEGDSGTKTATFTITRSGVITGQSSAHWATANRTATAPGDYLAARGDVTFAGGEPSKQVSVTINGDTALEPNETFEVALSNPIGATISRGIGVGTVTNDDRLAAQDVVLNPSIVQRGGSSTGTVTLNGTAAADTTVTLSSKDPTAASVPPSVVVPRGRDRADFQVTTAAVTADTRVGICASSPSDVTVCKELEVQAPRLTAVALNPTSVVAGNSSDGTVTLDRPVQGGDITVALTSSNPSVAQVPSSVLVLNGQATSVPFKVTTDAAMTGNAEVLISATANRDTRSVTLAVQERELIGDDDPPPCFPRCGWE